MLRDYVCKSNFKYAVGFHTFKGDKIAIDKKSIFNATIRHKKAVWNCFQTAFSSYKERINLQNCHKGHSQVELQGCQAMC